MNYQRETFRHLSAACLLLLAGITISACSSSSSPEPATVLQGQITDTAVAGLSYTTPTQSGTTDANGSFSYIAGETVTFSAGALEIASVPGKATLNWFELGGLTAIPSSYSEIVAVLYDEFDSNGDGVYDGPSLARVGAIASVLTTLDEDRNSANGILIAPEVAALVTADVDLKLEYATSPRFNADFKRLVRKAVADGLLSLREIRHGGLEVADMYGRMGIAAGYKVSTRNTRDDNADGIDNWVRILTYNTNGQVVRDEYDNDNDTVIDDVYTQSYSAELHGDVYTTDRGNDGVERTRDWDLDEFGDLVRYEETADGSLYQLETRELDPATGLYTRREVINPSRGIHTIETWTMDSDGNRPTATIDYDGDGTPELNITLTYDRPNSLWTYREDDSNADGIADIISTRVFDADDRLLRMERDDNADGIVDYVKESSYDSLGNLMSEAVDQDNDGTLESQIIWQRDSRGLDLGFRQYENGQLTYAIEKTYDNSGNELTRIMDNDGDGQNDHAYSWTYNAQGQITEQRTDSDADGIVDAISTRSYNGSGQLTLTESDTNADGIVDSSNVYNYDAEGLLTGTQLVRNGVVVSSSAYLDYVTASIAGFLY